MGVQCFIANDTRIRNTYIYQCIYVCVSLKQLPEPIEIMVNRLDVFIITSWNRQVYFAVNIPALIILYDDGTMIV